jgi:hypothetical protein
MITFFRIYRKKFALPEKSYYTRFMDQGIQCVGSNDGEKVKQQISDDTCSIRDDGSG